MNDPRWRGIYRHGSGWRAVVRRGRARAPVTRHFPADTPLADMQEWRKDEQAKARLQRRTRAAFGQFSADARRYLSLVSKLPTITDRTREIGYWVAAFGARARDRITAGDVRALRDRWATDPRSAEDLRPLAAGTINRGLFT